MLKLYSTITSCMTHVFILPGLEVPCGMRTHSCVYADSRHVMQFLGAYTFVISVLFQALLHLRSAAMCWHNSMTKCAGRIGQNVQPGVMSTSMSTWFAWLATKRCWTVPGSLTTAQTALRLIRSPPPQAAPLALGGRGRGALQRALVPVMPCRPLTYLHLLLCSGKGKDHSFQKTRSWGKSQGKSSNGWGKSGNWKW